MKLNHIDPPPHDRWILVDLDDGSQDCADNPRASLHLARWMPKRFRGLGVYEWQVLRDGEFDHWASGRIGGWCDLPGARKT